MVAASLLAPRDSERSRLAQVVDAVEVPAVHARHPVELERHRRTVDAELFRHGEGALGALDSCLRLARERPRRHAQGQRVDELGTGRLVLEKHHHLFRELEPPRTTELLVSRTPGTRSAAPRLADPPLP